MDDATREDLVYVAKLAEQAERYEDMVDAISRIVKSESTSPLTPEERNLLSVAYKNVIGARRSAWRTISTRMEDHEYKKNQVMLDIAQAYRECIEEELTSKCNEILDVLDKYLINEQSEDNESKVFYRKMKGDYYRYMAEFCKADKKNEMSQLSLKAYTEAVDDANTLKATHPIRLGLALNFSVFYYEIMGEPDMACKLAKETFDSAIKELDGVEGDSYKDSTLILQLLRDNLTLWTSDTEGDRDVGLEDLEDQQDS